MQTVTERSAQLQKLTKREIAQIHIDQGGQMTLNTYLTWLKEELVDSVIQYERYKKLITP